MPVMGLSSASSHCFGRCSCAALSVDAASTTHPLRGDAVTREEMVIGQERDLRELAEMDNTAMREFGVPAGWCEDLRRVILDYLQPTKREG